MAGTQHFSPSDVQFQLVYDRGQCIEASYLKVIQPVRGDKQPKIDFGNGSLSRTGQDLKATVSISKDSNGNL